MNLLADYLAELIQSQFEKRIPNLLPERVSIGAYVVFQWRDICLVRTLTTQKRLKQKGISSTIYLGCGSDEGRMVAHAWLCGQYYVTGGDGSGYSIVDKVTVM